jgi:hypothetical protein
MTWSLHPRQGTGRPVSIHCGEIEPVIGKREPRAQREIGPQEKPNLLQRTESSGNCFFSDNRSLLEALVGIIKDRPAFKTPNLPGSFTALGQNIIDEALMSARHFFETDAGFRFCILDDLCVHGHFRITLRGDGPGSLKSFHRGRPVRRLNRRCRYAAADVIAATGR